MNKKNITELAGGVLSKLTQERASFLVAIGASAGGLEAIKAFLQHLPSELSASYIIIQHLSPDFDSVMHEILLKETNLKVEIIEHMQPLKGGTVYVMRKRQTLKLVNNVFQLSDSEPQESTHPIDEFFKSMAEDRATTSVAVVLSGSGTDGTVGATHVHELGGLVIAQDPASCSFPSMPQSVIDAHCADYVLAPEAMGEQLKQYFISSSESKLSLNEKRTAAVATDIFNWLKANSKVDFSVYKTSTLERRFSHRMSVLGIDKLEQYRDYIARESDEVEALANDLLIGVTEFFRDMAVWESLSEKIIKPMLLENSEEQQLRIWSIGCSSGEEAYSIAISFEKALQSLGKKTNYKIFATDIDQRAIKRASEGRYSVNKMNTLSNRDLSQYFDIHQGEYSIKSDIRDRMVFTRHNILEDPPFSKIDLIVCRNMLIYFQPSAQERIMSNLLFALENNGYLMLGLSESVASLKDYFSSIDRSKKLFQKTREYKKSISSGHDISQPGRAYSLDKSKNILARPNRVSVTISRDLKQSIQERLLETFLPATLVLDENFESLYSFGSFKSFSSVKHDGIFPQHYSKILPDELVKVISPVLQKVVESKKRICLSDVIIPEQSTSLKIDIRCFSHPNDATMHYYTISIFINDKQVASTQSSTKKTLNEIELQSLLDQRDDDLIDARLIISEKQGDLNDLGEELQSSNEELIASNEELQSTNEELHSVNEELYTVNAELQEKILQLEEANNDLDNILGLSNVGVVYLDNHLRIRRFTSEIRRYIKLLPVDISRPLFDISGDIDKKLLEEWLEAANKKQQRVDKVTYLLSDKNKRVKVVISPCFDRKQKSTGIILMLEELPNSESID